MRIVPTYSPPSRPALNQWGLGGSWNVSAESGTLESVPGKIVFRFHSRDLHMVLGPSKNGTPVRFKVKLNGTALGDDHGSDSSADGAGEVREPRMYQLVRQKGSVKDAVFEIEFLDPASRSFRSHLASQGVQLATVSIRVHEEITPAPFGAGRDPHSIHESLQTEYIKIIYE